MGSYAYILVAVFLMTGSIFLMSQYEDTNRADVDLYRVHMKHEARNAASSGLSVTLRLLAAEQEPWLVPSDFETGPHDYGLDPDGGPTATFQTVVAIVDSINGDTLDVVATGTKVYTTRKGIARDTTHVIEVRIARGVVENATPPAFRSALMSDLTMTIQGDFSLNSLIEGVNADLHTNGVLDARGNSFIVEGMGTYTGGVRVSDQQMDNFVPDNDWNYDDPNVFHRAEIPLPTWDVDAFRTNAQAVGYYSPDPLIIDGNVIAATGATTVDQYAELVLGLPPGDYGLTEDAPLLIMTDNTVTFDNAVYLDGFVQFGSTGQIDVLTHGPNDGLFLSYTIDEPNHTAYTHAGLFTTEAIRIEGNATIQGTLYAEGSITYLGGTHLVGGQVAKDASFRGGGTIDIDWVGAGSGVTEYFGPFDEPIGPVIVAWAEW